MINKNEEKSNLLKVQTIKIFPETFSLFLHDILLCSVGHSHNNVILSLILWPFCH